MPGVMGLYVLKRVEVRDKAALTSVGRCSKVTSVEYLFGNAPARVGERTWGNGGEMRREVKSLTPRRERAMSWHEE
jgi:hypothetical protein